MSKYLKFIVLFTTILSFVVLQPQILAIIVNSQSQPDTMMLAQTETERKTEAERLIAEGDGLFEEGKFRPAIQSYQKAIAIYEGLGDTYSVARYLNYVGITYSQLYEYEAAIDYFQESLAFANRIDNDKLKLVLLRNLGRVYNTLPNYEKAREHAQQHLELARNLDNLSEQGQALNNLGLAYHSLGKYPEAIQSHEARLAIAIQLKDKKGELQALNNLGTVYDTISEYEKAREYHEQALAIARKLPDKKSESNALGNLGLAYYSQGNYDKAIELQQESLKIAQEIDDKVGIGAAFLGLGQAYNAKAEYALALESFDQSLTLAQETADPYAERAALSSLGLIHRFLGEYKKAEEHHRKHLEVAEKTKNPQSQAIALNSLGIIKNLQGKYEEAIWGRGTKVPRPPDLLPQIAFLEKGLELAREIDDPDSEAVALGSLAQAYHFQKDYDKSIEYLQQRLAIADEIKDPRGKSIALGNLGNAYHAQGKLSQALKYHEQSWEIARQIEDIRQEANALGSIGLVLLDSGELPAAERHLREAITTLEVIRENLQDKDELKISIFEIHSSPYRLLQTALIAQNQPQEALEIAERGRARAFVELLQRRLSPQKTDSVKIKPPSIAEIQQIAAEQNATLVEYSLIPSDNELYIWVIRPTGEIAFRRSVLNSQKNNIKNLVKVTLESIGVRGDSPTEELDFAPGDLVKLKDDAKDSEPWEVVEYNAENGILSLTLSSFPPGIAISHPVTAVAAKVSSRRTNNRNFQQLHEILIEPIAEFLPTDPEARVIFIPHGELFQVPFPALQDEEGNYLIEKYPILTAPAIEVLKLTHERKQQVPGLASGVLVVGNPSPMPENYSPIEGSEEEAKIVAQLLNTKPIIGKDATESAIKQQLSTARLIHIATHGTFDDEKPLEGAIALGKERDGDGLLKATEILEYKLNAELFVLSACNTARGKITGDGVIGLSRSLFAAGVPSVIVSLWQVPDKEVTPLLMEEFYKNLQRNLDKAKALRQAMVATMAKHPEPEKWAAFTLIGEAY